MIAKGFYQLKELSQVSIFESVSKILETTMEFAISFTVVFLALAQIEPSSQLKCTQNSRTSKGICAIDSEQCCISAAGNECKRELGQFIDTPAPVIGFLPNSVIFDQQSNRLCLKGLDMMEEDNSHSLLGVYLEVSIFEPRYVNPVHFASNSFIFPGHVTSTALREGLFCLQLDMEEEVLSKTSTFFTIDMVPLPPAIDRLAVSYSSGSSQSNFISLNDVIKSKAVLQNCREWIEKPEVKEQEEMRTVPSTEF